MPNRHLLLLAVFACADPTAPTGAILSVDTARIDFGGVTCGRAKSQIVTIANDGDAELDAALLSTLPGVTIVPDRVTLQAGERTTVEIVAAVPQLAVPGPVSAGDVLISGTGGSFALPITFTPSGAVVTLEQSTVDFGVVLPFAAVDRDIVVKVAGNEPVTVALADPPRREYILKGSTTVEMPGNTTHPFTVTMISSVLEGPIDAAVPITVTGNLCAPPPASAQLTTLVTRDLLTATPLVDFGTPACGEAPTRTIELVNHSDEQARYEVFHFDVVGFLGPLPQQGMSPASSSSTVTLTHQRIPDDIDLIPSSYEALVDIEWPDPTVFRRVRVRTTIDRPVLRADTREVDVGEVPTGTVIGLAVTVTNTGSKTDTITVERLDPTAATTTTFSPQAFQLAPGGSQIVQVNVRPEVEGPAIDGVVFRGSCGDDYTAIRAIAK